MKWLLALSFWLLVGCTHATSQPKVELGNELFIREHLDLVRGKLVGLVVNHTAQLSSGEFLVDALLANGVKVVALFGPEHGIRGEAAAGEKVADAKDEKTGIPIFSLYGKTKKPTAEMLSNVDVLVYDIQDVGVRFYTYISTMGLCMEAAAEKGIPFIVLDRPNPLGGKKIDGPIMEDSLRSFVGMYPIPVVYGLTCGELATIINEEGWLTNRAKCKLTVIKMEGWKREMLWSDTGLKWIPPSPNITTFQTALAYPATCFVEATNLSEGRGTEKPFQFIGAPFMIDARMRIADMLVSALNVLRLDGVKFSSTVFTPSSSKFKNQRCGGVFVEVSNWDSFHPFATGLHIIQQARRLYPSHVEIRERSLLRLLGSRKAYDDLIGGVEVNVIAQSWKKGCKDFRKLSIRYFMY